MSEFASQPSLVEVLNPRNTPEMGFQSYESLKGNGAYRDQQQELFMNGAITNPTLDYPFLDEQKLIDGIKNLHNVLDLADAQTDPEKRAAIWDSASYRMAEMYWLLSSERLMRIRPKLSDQEVTALAAETQELGEQLYSKPEKEISDSIVAEVWAQVDTKELVGSAVVIKQELEHGTTVHAGGADVRVAPLKRVEAERLPEIPADLLVFLEDKFYRDNPDVVELVGSYWTNVVQQRPEGERAFTPEDMFDIFAAVHTLRDPENKSGVQIIMDPDATALSWETPLMAVKVGGRRQPIKETKELLSKIYHEYIVHGGRAVAGSDTSLPVLGTGLFTEADDGEVSDYLTFEEGLAGTCELSIVHADKEGWTPTNIEKSLALELAYEGRDFRQTYETLWRARVLMNAKSGVEPSEQMITNAKRNAYTSTVRIFRGTPTDLPRHTQDGQNRVLTFNKDLAYVKGKLQLIEFWERYKSDPAMLDLIFKAKFDPMNSRQREIVQKTYGLVA